MAAVDEIVKLLGRFTGPPVDHALAHADMARAPDPDEDDLIEALAGLLHLSEYSDGFGFDMLGWLAPHGSVTPRAMLVEVKSTAGGLFHLSPSEWRCAENFHDLYSVLVVRRPSEGAVPKSLDLLNDPVRLVAADLLAQSPDGYVLKYTAKA